MRDLEPLLLAALARRDVLSLELADGLPPVEGDIDGQRLVIDVRIDSPRRLTGAVIGTPRKRSSFMEFQMVRRGSGSSWHTR